MIRSMHWHHTHYSIGGNEDPVLDAALYNVFIPGGIDIQAQKRHEQERREYTFEQSLLSGTTQVLEYWGNDNCKPQAMQRELLTNQRQSKPRTDYKSCNGL